MLFDNLKKNVYSQNGEDGIIDYILNKIPDKDNWCCEFGAWDGKYLSNTYESYFINELSTDETIYKYFLSKWVMMSGYERP
jgi:hypothetical protein